MVKTSVTMNLSVSVSRNYVTFKAEFNDIAIPYDNEIDGSLNAAIDKAYDVLSASVERQHKAYLEQRPTR